MIKEQLSHFLSVPAIEQLKFADVIAFIDANFVHNPTAFKNGAQTNTATENQGSAKLLYLGKLLALSKEETLKLFGEHYQSVLDTQMKPITRTSGNLC